MFLGPPVEGVYEGGASRSRRYVLCAIGPVMVSSAISHFVFGEVHGRANRAAFAAALGLQSLGVVLIAVG